VRIVHVSLRPFIGLVLLLALATPAGAQTTYTWNYSGTGWSSATSWTPNGVPTSADTAILGTFDATTFNLPTFSANGVAGDFRILGPRPFSFAGTVTGNGNTLTLGTGGVMSTAPLTQRSTFGHSLTLNNLRINVANGTSLASGFAETIGAVELSGFSSRIVLSNTSQLRLVNAAGTANYDLTINGGSQLVVNAGTQVTNGVGVNGAVQGAIRFHGGGSLNFLGGNNVATTFDANQVVAASGHSSVGVSFGGTGTVTVNLGNGTLQRGIDHFTRDSTGAVISLGTGTVEFNFNGPIPGFTGSQATLVFRPGSTGVPMQNGVIVENISSNGNSPYAILTGTVPGIDGMTGRFATWNAGTGAVTAQLGVQRSEATLSATPANENVIYRPTTSSANATLTANISPQTVVFEPRGLSQSVDLGGFTLTTPGIIVERTTSDTTAAFEFSLTNGTVTTPGGSPLNIYVLGASNTVFKVGANIANASGSLVKSGLGTMELTGNTPQLNSVLDIYINQGALRARIDGPNANFGTNNVLHLRGGVLEVDANGGTSTFTRSLGQSLFNQVTWNFGTSTMFSDRGGGGFSVVNGNLNVNIGGGTNLVWNGSSGGNEFFIRSGQSLRFGSFRSTGVVTLQNNLALDDSSAGLPFESREIITEALTTTLPVYAQRTRITGVISGSAATGLIKAGPSILELTAANTYAGGTSVAVGALLVNNTTGSATGSGRVVVYDTLMGNGIIAPANGNGVTIMPKTTSAQIGLALYRDQAGGTPANLTVGSAGTNNPVVVRAGTGSVFQVNGTTFDPAGGSTSYSRLTVLGTGSITITGSTLTIGLSLGFTPANSDLFGILDNQTGNAITGTFASGATVQAFRSDNTLAGTFQVSYVGNISGSTVSISGGNDVVLHNFTPIPEPASIFAIGAVTAGVAGFVRRVRRVSH
jgi:autotransporter-associated beta strand protein